MTNAAASSQEEDISAPATLLEEQLFIFNALPAAYLLLSPELKIEAASDGYLQATLTERDKLIGQYIFDAFPDNPEAVEAHAVNNLKSSLLKVLSTAQPHEMELQHYDVPDPKNPGQFVKRHWLPRNTPVLGPDGRVRHIIHCVANVTDKIKIEGHLRESRTREAMAHAAAEENEQARQQVDAINQELEARVALRTQELQQARQQAEWQRKRIQDIFMQAPVAIGIFTGKQYTVELVNPLMCGILGKEAEELLGKSLFEAAPGLAGQGFKAIFTDMLHTGKPYIRKEMPVNHKKDGKEKTRFYDVVYEPFRDDQKEITGVILILTEVTEQLEARLAVESGKQQAQTLASELAVANEKMQLANAEIHASNTELSNTNEQLKRINTELDSFIYTASHDLKAPILNIEGLVEALRDELPPESLRLETIQRLISMMLESVKCFKNTIYHLTEITRLQKETAVEVEAVDVQEVVTSVQMDLANLIEEASAQLLVDVSESKTVSFARKNLRSILYNLLSNALKYRSPDRPLIVNVRGYATAQYHVLSVSDNGLGVDLTQQSKLFGMFKRLHMHVEGSGIGLYMVKKILDNAGGKIEVSSTVGEGTTFSVFFPLTN
ncbi:PAS domain-containing sensor histidine kinase [Pontibacter mangrovi]|uniref:histidine kinase n=1 Tax=Pontibacter mangrovi TaxID=2589816 RepID=A0A501W7I4_9BACT|nr:PAS domain-containing protein [Pontibacter mangrovi]TPE42827.1 PAS domain-containing protein [Pontibacter mangrovi]